MRISILSCEGCQASLRPNGKKRVVCRNCGTVHRAYGRKGRGRGRPGIRKVIVRIPRFIRR